MLISVNGSTNLYSSLTEAQKNVLKLVREKNLRNVLIQNKSGGAVEVSIAKQQAETFGEGVEIADGEVLSLATVDLENVWFNSGSALSIRVIVQ